MNNNEVIIILLFVACNNTLPCLLIKNPFFGTKILKQVINVAQKKFVHGHEKVSGFFSEKGVLATASGACN